MRILVTGATGVFGRALCERLTGRGDEVVAMARRAPARPLPATEFRAGDVRDVAAVTAAMERCDAVAHLAWALTPLESREATEQLDVGGTRNVLAAMKATGCRRIVFASSVLAYGAIPRGGQVLREDEPLRPDREHLYGTHKAMAEDAILSAGVEAVVVRAGVTAGRGSHGNTIFRFLSGPTLIDASDGDRAWQLAHPDDVGRFFVRALHGERTGPVNLAAPDLIAFDRFARLLGRPLMRMSSGALTKALGVAWEHGILDFAPSEAQSIAFMPKVDTTALSRDWDFHCAWSTADTARDVARGVAGRIALMDWKEFALPGAVLFPRVDAAERTGLRASLGSAVAEAGATDRARRDAVPSLLRPMVRRRADAALRRLGADLVTEAVAPAQAAALPDAVLGAQLGLAADRVVQVGAVLAGSGIPIDADLDGVFVDEPGATAPSGKVPDDAAGLWTRAGTTLGVLIAEAGTRLAARGHRGSVAELAEVPITELVELLESPARSQAAGRDVREDGPVGTA